MWGVGLRVKGRVTGGKDLLLFTHSLTVETFVANRGNMMTTLSYTDQQAKTSVRLRSIVVKPSLHVHGVAVKDTLTLRLFLSQSFLCVGLCVEYTSLRALE